MILDNYNDRVMLFLYNNIQIYLTLTEKLTFQPSWIIAHSRMITILFSSY